MVEALRQAGGVLRRDASGEPCRLRPALLPGGQRPAADPRRRPRRHGVLVGAAGGPLCRALHPAALRPARHRRLLPHSRRPGRADGGGPGRHPRPCRHRPGADAGAFHRRRRSAWRWRWTTRSGSPRCSSTPAPRMAMPIATASSRGAGSCSRRWGGTPMRNTPRCCSTRPIGSTRMTPSCARWGPRPAPRPGAPEVQASRLDAHPPLRPPRRIRPHRTAGAGALRRGRHPDAALLLRGIRPADRRRQIGLRAARRPRAVPHRAGVARRGRAPLPGRPRMMRIPRRTLPLLLATLPACAQQRPWLRGGAHRCEPERQARANPCHAVALPRGTGGMACGDTGDGWRPWHCCPAAPWRRPAGRASRHGRSRRPRRLWQRPAPRPPAWCGRRCRSIPASRPRRRSPPPAPRRCHPAPRHARRRPAGAAALISAASPAARCAA